MNIDPLSSIIWIDSNPNVDDSIGLLKAQNWHVTCFNKTNDALNALHQKYLKPENIKCVIKDMLMLGGEQGYLNEFRMLEEIKLICKQAGPRDYPLMVVISLTANTTEYQRYGIDIVVHGSRTDVCHQLIDQLDKRFNNSYKKVIFIGIAGPSGCGKTTYAKHLVNYIQSPFLAISLDKFFTRPIYIDHSILGYIKSYEHPETLNVTGFLDSLLKLKTQWKQSGFDRSEFPVENNKPIYVVVEGFLLFALSDVVTSLFDIRIFLDSTKDRCRMQRFRRSNKIDPKLPESQITITNSFSLWYDNLVWTEYLKRRSLQITNAEKVFQAEEYQNMDYSKLNLYIINRLKEIL